MEAPEEAYSGVLKASDVALGFEERLVGDTLLEEPTFLKFYLGDIKNRPENMMRTKPPVLVGLVGWFSS